MLAVEHEQVIINCIDQGWGVPGQVAPMIELKRSLLRGVIKILTRFMAGGAAPHVISRQDGIIKQQLADMPYLTQRFFVIHQGKDPFDTLGSVQ
jgi:hypothetical protein